MLQNNYRIARSCGRNNQRACACGLRIFCSWRKLHEKNFLHFDGVLLPCVVICKNAAMPEWVQNYRTVFPASEYFAQRGSDDIAEKSFFVAESRVTPLPSSPKGLFLRWRKREPLCTFSFHRRRNALSIRSRQFGPELLLPSLQKAAPCPFLAQR